MIKLIYLFIFIFSISAFASECEQAKARLEIFFSSQVNKCQKDDDCEGFYIRANTCASAVILPKNIYSKSFESKLLVQQSIVRAACSKEWGQGPACSPQPFHAVCKNQKCVEPISQ